MLSEKLDILLFINSQNEKSCPAYKIHEMRGFKHPKETYKYLKELSTENKISYSGRLNSSAVISITGYGEEAVENHLKQKAAELTASSEHSDNVTDGVQQQSDSKKNLADKKWYQVVMLIATVVAAIVGAISLVISFVK